MTGELRLKSSKWPHSEVYAGQFFSTPWYAIPWNEFWMIWCSVLQDFSIFRWTRVGLNVFMSRFLCFHVDKSRPWELTASFSPPAPVLNTPVQHWAQPYSEQFKLCNVRIPVVLWYCGIATFFLDFSKLRTTLLCWANYTDKQKTLSFSEPCFW